MQLHAYCVASKRYALLNMHGDELDVRKWSEHGLGAFETPVDPGLGKRIEKWEREVWRHLVSEALGREPELPDWAHQAALTQIRIATPAQLRWFDTYNRGANGRPLPYERVVKPHNFLGHAMPKDETALPDGASANRFCLVAPLGERRRFVNRHDPKGRVYTAGVDFRPKTYADLIEGYGRYPERKFAGPEGQPCDKHTRGLLRDLAVVVTGIRHVGKESNDLEEHKADVVEEEERQLEYHDSAFDDLVRSLRPYPTKVLAEATGYDPWTVRKLKRGEFKPSERRLSKLVAVACMEVTHTYRFSPTRKRSVGNSL